MHTSNTEQKQLSTDIQEANKESLSKPETQLLQRQKEIRAKLNKPENSKGEND